MNIRIFFVFYACASVIIASQQNVSLKNEKSTSTLSDKLQKLFEKYPFLQNIHQQQSPSQEQSSLLNYDTAHIVLNLATISYIFHSLYYEYEAYSSALRNPDESESFTQKIIQYHINLLFPQLNITLGTHLVFFIRSVSIIILAMCYKTIAKLILLSIQGDFFDFIGSMFARTLSVVRSKYLFPNLSRMV